MDKRRKLDQEARAFIIANALDPEWTDAKFAEKFGVTSDTIQRFRMSKGIKKTNGFYDPEAIRQKIKDAQSDNEKRELFKMQFATTSRATRLRSMLDPADFTMLAEKWVDYKMQLPDTTPAEEDVLEKMLLVDLRILYNQRSMRQAQQVQEQLRKQMNSKGELDPENDKDLQILQTIDAQNAQEIELNKQYAILLKEYNVLQESLNATRKQREQNQKVGAETFFDLIKKFNQDDVREEVGRINELQKKSMSKKMTELQKPHKYLDGQIDVPILDGANVAEYERKKKEQENEKSNSNGG